MGIFFVYILKTSVCLAVFYLFYRLLLSRETFHRFNRIAVLGVLLLSLILPLCEITVKEQTEVQQTMLSWEQLLLMADDTTEVVPEVKGSTVNFVHVIFIVYLAGILFFICRNLYSLMRVVLLLKSSRQEKLQDNIILVIHSKDELSPFSWLKYVVISEKDLRENGREILIHELAHIRNRHSLDLFIADVCIFFQWFNPGAWLLKQELQNIHEYEADETVLKEGVDAKQYQLLIIKKAVGTRLYSMANSFNHSKLKKRITMMLKEKSSPWARLKYLYVLPLAAIAVTAFARPEISNELKEISSVKVNDLAAIAEGNISEKVSVQSDSTITVTYNLKKTTPVNGDSVVVTGYKTGKNEVGTVEKLNIREFRITDENVELNGKIIDVNTETSSFKVTIKDDSETSEDIPDGKDSPLFFVDGVEVNRNIFSSLDVNRISAVSVLKDKNAISAYGEKASNGVVLISLKRPEYTGVVIRPENVQQNKDEMKVTGLVQGADGQPVVSATVLITGTPIGTTTDLEGRFTLNAPKDGSLTVTYTGMKKTVVKTEPMMTIRLKAD